MGMPTMAHAQNTERPSAIQEKRLTLDERGRITIGKADGVVSYKAVYHQDGSITLNPMGEVPIRELWLWQNKAALASVQRGLAAPDPNRARKPLDLSSLPDGDDEE
jgi:hypothetical protein